MTLLPTNTTATEAALEQAMLAMIDIGHVGDIKDPRTCPVDELPFLAWELGISHWDSDWSDAEKRVAIMAAIPFHKIKGTAAAVRQVLDRFHPLLQLVEGKDAVPRRAPHTFEVRAPSEISATVLTPATIDAIVRDVAAAKPLRSHFDFVQTFAARTDLFLTAGGVSVSIMRQDADAGHDTTRDWSLVLQTETGEPIYLAGGGELLEEAA